MTYDVDAAIADFAIERLRNGASRRPDRAKQQDARN